MKNDCKERNTDKNSVALSEEGRRRLPNPISAYIGMFKNWSDFKGRSIRLEYWSQAPIHVLICFSIVLISSAVASLFTEDVSAVMVYAILGYITLIALPLLSLTVRRLHDAGYPSFALVLILIPALGWYGLICMLGEASVNCDNKYGPNPYPKKSESVETESKESKS